eukprot:g20658.t1
MVHASTPPWTAGTSEVVAHTVTQGEAGCGFTCPEFCVDSAGPRIVKLLEKQRRLPLSFHDNVALDACQRLGPVSSEHTDLGTSWSEACLLEPSFAATAPLPYPAPVPGGKNVNNYANVDLIVEVAESQGVDAVWPGWGHASENPKLPDKLKPLGITFIGPTSPVMSVLGDKIAANILAQTAGVPSIPWSGDGLEANLGPDGTIPEEHSLMVQSTVEQAKEVVKNIGFPVMIKASEGGGGKGIRMVQEEKDLETSFIQVQNEVPGSPIFMMQLCQGARHIEVQIVGDEHGNAVALNGRDCSTQRRFQKIFEEGPPVVVPRDTFLEMERAAQRLTQNIGYIGAGSSARRGEHEDTEVCGSPVVGEIRNPVEYLVELLQQEAFIQNTIDTSWLDGLIKEKSVTLSYNINDVVFYAAVFRAVQNLKVFDAEVQSALAKSQLGPLREMAKMNKFPVEITFEGVVVHQGPDLRYLAQIMAQPDGTFLVSVGATVMSVMGSEEALGLRLRLDGVGTIMLPTVYDPSELRSEFNGKVVRYLQDNGSMVQEGEPYVELEAMKMIMPIKATATGKVSHLRGAGSIVSAGEMLGTLELKDPSKVKKIVPFDGDFDISTSASIEKDRDLQSQIEMVLDGFASPEDAGIMTQKLFSELPQAERSQVAQALFERYLSVEQKFSPLIQKKLTSDQIYAEFIAENKEIELMGQQGYLHVPVEQVLLSWYQDNLSAVASLALAHGQLAARSAVVVAALRSLRTLSAPDAELMDAIQRLSELANTGGYGEVVLVARRTLEMRSAKPFGERVEALRELLDVTHPDLDGLCGMPATKAGSELLSDLLLNESSTVRSNALNALMRPALQDMEINDEGAGKMTCNFKFQFPGTAEEAVFRQAHVKVVKTFDDVKEVMKGEIPLQDESNKVANTLKVVVTSPGSMPFDDMSASMEKYLAAAGEQLQAAGMREVGLVVSDPPHAPRYASFMADSDMKPSLPNVLEVYRLAEEYKLEKVVPPVGRNSQVYVGTPIDVGPSKRNPSTIFARMIKHSMDPENTQAWHDSLESLMLNAVDEIERARLNPKIGYGPNGNIFAHILYNLNMEATSAYEMLEEFVNNFVAKHGSRLQKSKVDEIVVKVGIGSGDSRKQTLRLTASSMTGEYLRTSGALEMYDVITGSPTQWFDLKSGDEAKLASAKAKNRLQLRRSDSGGMRDMPSKIFSSTELVLVDGELKEIDREPGQNNIGMITWRCTLCTPEYPEGRDLVLLANDVTHKAGSFGVDEDVLFQKASEYARDRGLPRIHIACNSGARVGLAEELKPFFKVKWTNDDPSKGFDYLYLEEKDLKSLPDDAVDVHVQRVNGKKHFVIDAIIGEGLKSTQGGIGVENLQGSGLIAGETSKAYNEVFTLSYVTGRSVGIGAYLNRLGQRVIQMVNGPMILTGFSALNKLLGKNVYSSQDQLGGPQVMVPNGITHQVVTDDTEGVGAILDWLSYVPKTAHENPPMLDPLDPISREVTFVPSKTPYDPRHMLAGTSLPEGSKLTGFFDEGTFREYLPGWGKSVVVGRGKLGGIPMGVIAVETRRLENTIPADPANPASQEVVEPQAGQVWFPDSAFKTATAIRDFNRGENLPLIIFANWRGFSGGTRDMYQEVLKFGAQIVDALVEYKSPVFVYIPPGGELRGGSWVVIDPTINPEQMEPWRCLRNTFEDKLGRYNACPPGIVEVKFRAAQQRELMHRLDPDLRKLDAMLEESSSSEVGTCLPRLQDKLAPLYTQIACEFADLHDRTGRMEATGVIRQGLEWRHSREFFYWRDVQMLLSSWLSEASQDDDKSIAEKLKQLKVDVTKRQIKALLEKLPESEREGLV